MKGWSEDCVYCGSVAPLAIFPGGISAGCDQQAWGSLLLWLQTPLWEWGEGLPWSSGSCLMSLSAMAPNGSLMLIS